MPPKRMASRPLTAAPHDQPLPPKSDATKSSGDDQNAPQVWLVSACLAGKACRYDGQQAKKTAQNALQVLPQNATLIPFCPEEAGAMMPPRPAAHFVGGDGAAVLEGEASVLTIDGQDVTAAFVSGANLAVAQAQRSGATHACLKARSPSCGSARVYQASPSAPSVPTLIDGQGVTTATLRRAGLVVLSDEDLVTQTKAPPSS